MDPDLRSRTPADSPDARHETTDQMTRGVRRPCQSTGEKPGQAPELSAAAGIRDQRRQTGASSGDHTKTAAKAHQCTEMCTPVGLADLYPSATCDTPTSTCHVIIARAELHDRPHLVGTDPKELLRSQMSWRLVMAMPSAQAQLPRTAKTQSTRRALPRTRNLRQLRSEEH
jgi:hypothetical protein